MLEEKLKDFKSSVPLCEALKDYFDVVAIEPERDFVMLDFGDISIAYSNKMFDDKPNLYISQQLDAHNQYREKLKNYIKYATFGAKLVNSMYHTMGDWDLNLPEEQLKKYKILTKAKNAMRPLAKKEIKKVEGTSNKIRGEIKDCELIKAIFDFGTDFFSQYKESEKLTPEGKQKLGELIYLTKQIYFQYNNLLLKLNETDGNVTKYLDKLKSEQDEKTL